MTNEQPNETTIKAIEDADNGIVETAGSVDELMEKLMDHTVKHGVAGYVTITAKEYADLVKDSDLLACLKAAGVENWSEYNFALDIHNGDLL